eukprot:comp12330_c0_seq1/m.7189 comp12330_c0_seq1/g.7189  ORF comp12330_c0_seq1/g.7189 comp12330_c0_seq1/m.7189 type:complete len:187 (-) comp12330_c0_seq1:449-1009(-)
MFDYQNVTRNPTTTLRVVEILFSIIVFGCIADKCKPSDYCVFNDSGACNFGIFVGVFSLLLTFVFIGTDYTGPIFGSMQRLFGMLELAVTATTTLLWTIAFVYMADQWRKDQGPPSFLGITHWPTGTVNNAQAAVVFAFFSVFAWMGSTYSALVRLRDGTQHVSVSAGEYAEPRETFYQGGGYQSG